MGYSNSEGKTTYFNVAEGKFRMYRGKDAEPEPFDTIEGNLKSLSFYQDRAPGYDEKTVFRMVLEDGDETIVVKSTQGTVFTRMFAGYLHGIDQGDRIQLRVKPGSENKKVTSCFVEHLEDDHWVKAAYDPVTGSDGEKLRRVTEIITGHAAYEDYTPPQADNGQAAPGIGTEQKRMLDILERFGYPPFAVYGKQYMEVLRRVLKDNDLQLKALTETQFKFLADAFEKAGPERAKWPKELRDIPASDYDEYDPFADE